MYFTVGGPKFFNHKHTCRYICFYTVIINFTLITILKDEAFKEGYIVKQKNSARGW